MNGLVAAVSVAGVQLESAGDQGEVAEGLGGVAELAPGFGVPFFAEKPDVIAEVKKSFEQFGGFGLSAGEVQGVDEPEGAGKEQPFSTGQSVPGVGGLVPLDEAVFGELVLDRGGLTLSDPQKRC